MLKGCKVNYFMQERVKMNNDYSSIRHKLYSAMFALREVKRDEDFNDVCFPGRIQHTLDELLKIESLLKSMIENIDFKENKKIIDELNA